MKGYLPLALSDGGIHWQLCYYSANAIETIISPQAVLALSNRFTSWTMTGYKTKTAGTIRFDCDDNNTCMSLDLVCRDGLYYCPSDVFTLGTSPTMVTRVLTTPNDVPTHTMLWMVHPSPPAINHHPPRTVPTSKAHQLESESGSSALVPLGYPNSIPSHRT